MKAKFKKNETQEKIDTFGKKAKQKYGIQKNANFKLPDRTWADNDITKHPRWASVDLRDGNQSLERPMTVEQKLKYFKILVNIGFKEIEVGFPAASQEDFNFVRKLIDNNLIPNDVTIQVLVQAREKIIEKTKESLIGATNVIVHLYNSTSTDQREIVFKHTTQDNINLALEGVRYIKTNFGNFQGNMTLQYSPESFTGTEIEHAYNICQAVIKEWNRFKGEEIIINLPATIENSTPDRYADKIERMTRMLKNNEKRNTKNKVTISLHTHNDRGTGIASTELGLKAGADRIEGVIIPGLGERAGNISIVNVALNMYTQGIAPGLDLSHIGKITKQISKITSTKIDINQPYIGDLVHTAYSGSHQDAIKKGLDQVKTQWIVPYLPIDPRDIGLKYKPIVINSQSGKGGTAYILQQLGFNIPKRMQPAIASITQPETEKKKRSLSNQEILEIFTTHFIDTPERFLLNDKSPTNGNISSIVDTFREKTKIDFKLTQHEEQKKDDTYIFFSEIQINKNKYYGVGIDKNRITALQKSITNALNNSLHYDLNYC